MSPLTAPQPLPVVVATATIMDGQVVRWYRSQTHAAAHACSVSASGRRVSVHDDNYQTLPQEWVLLAMDVHRQLVRDPGANVEHVATHRRVGLTDTLEPR
jgi:hypothetical protein